MITYGICFTCIAWKYESTPVCVRPFTVGPRLSLLQSRVNIFGFTSEVLHLIVTETNRYACQCLEGSDRNWSTDENEIRAYLGFCILMGIVRQPEIRDYWSRNELLHYSPIANHISRHMFEEISRYLHFTDNATLPQRHEARFHCLQKVKGLVDQVRAHFAAVYYPRCISVDEAMVPFKGKVHISYVEVQSQ